VTKVQSVIVRVQTISDKPPLIYCVGKIEFLNQVSHCPVTRHPGEFDYAFLRNVSDDLFDRIIKTEDNLELVNLCDSISFYKGTFKSNSNGQIAGLFSNSRQGVVVALFAGLASTAISLQFNNHPCQSELVVKCSAFQLGYLLYGIFFGAITANCTSEEAGIHNKLATIAFIFLVLLGTHQNTLYQEPADNPSLNM
jgi:hypothetical protein